MHLKKVIQERRISLLHRGPLCTDKNLYPWIPFFSCILSLGQVYIFEIYVKFCIFWYPWSPYCEKKILDLYIVYDPKCFEQRWSGHWVKPLFSFIFVTFERYVTNLRGTFVPVPISTHPTVQYVFVAYISRSTPEFSDVFSKIQKYGIKKKSFANFRQYKQHI
jgi:hypothetical protein